VKRGVEKEVRDQLSPTGVIRIACRANGKLHPGCHFGAPAPAPPLTVEECSRLPALSKSRIPNSLLNSHVLSQVLKLTAINIQETLVFATTGQWLRTIAVSFILSDIYRLQHCLNLWYSEVKQAPFGSPQAAPVRVECSALSCSSF
jgi:hypothetical protein